MYLKSIEIQGFKSFANKILFEFHNGITGIVGPNGSGKSNVADAVRWVLGEQRSRQLRGGTMQDVIFAGTELRKPQGFAYVAITLDNADHKLPIEYDEVTVSRRLYRSGESEYKINGTSCRLKDINELFYDTGIGKEGYSIIGQGQIDQILSGRPEERRELFDEAAGIVKFKRRKAIAQKKLEDEKQNLIRVTDILSELEKQVGPLERQSEEAKEYLRLREELRCLDANLFLAESEELKRQIREVEQKEMILTGDQESVRAESETLKSEYELLGIELDALDAAIAADREACSREDLERQEKTGRIGVLREQIRTEQMNEEHIRSRMASIDGEMHQKEEEQAEYESEKQALNASVQTIEAKQQEAEAAVRSIDEAVSRTETLIETAKAEIMDALNQKAELAARRQRYETMLEQADVRRAEVTQKLLKFKSDESVQEEQKKEEEAKLSKHINDSFCGFSVIKSYVTEEETLKQFNEINNDLKNKNIEYNKITSSINSIVTFFQGLGFSISCIFGLYLVVNGSITIGSFIAFNSIIQKVMKDYLYAGFLVEKANMIKIIYKRIQFLYDIETNTDGNIKMPENANIQINNLNFKYKGEKENILENINLSIPAGSFIGILGKTGSGKTTLANILAKFYETPAGKIFFNDIDINDIERKSFYEKFAYVMQDDYIYDNTIQHNIELYKKYNKNDIKDAVEKAELFDTIEKLDKKYNTLIGDNGIKLSGGQKQRLILSRNIVTNPNILIIDNGFTGLDIDTRKKVVDNLNNRNNKTTLVIISSMMEDIKNADKIYKLENKTLVKINMEEEVYDA